MGVRSFKARTDLGYKYVCHLGDFAGELPFYNRTHSIAEISVMAAWCTDQRNPVIFDVGANTGFVATQLGQRLNAKEYQIFAFEPVWSTFQKLKTSIEKLGLEPRIQPICCAISDREGICSVAFSDQSSLFAQVRADTLNDRVGHRMAWAPTVTIDAIVNTLKVHPTLLKIDVEGLEGHVLRGAKRLLSHGGDLAICFEFNPLTLAEVGSSPAAIASELAGYSLFYVDDFAGQKYSIGHRISNICSLEWVANIIAVSPSCEERLRETLGRLRLK